MTVPEKILEIMEWNNSQKMTQAELAKRTGLSKSSINGYVRGERKLTIDAAQKIADALEVSLWTLLNGDPLAVTPIDLTQRERTLISEYRRLDEEEREAIDGLIRVQNRKKR